MKTTIEHVRLAMSGQHECADDCPPLPALFVTDEGIVPTCDICDGPQLAEGDDWDGETGNHRSCQELENDLPADAGRPMHERCGYAIDAHVELCDVSHVAGDPDAVAAWECAMVDDGTYRRCPSEAQARAAYGDR